MRLCSYIIDESAFFTLRLARFIIEVFLAPFFRLKETFLRFVIFFFVVFTAFRFLAMLPSCV